VTADLASLRTHTLALLGEWTPIAGISGADSELLRMAGAVESHLRGMGAVVLPTGQRGGAPLVHARIDRGAATTLLLYNMYDVMPAPMAGWSVDPFRGGVIERPGLGPCFVGRGAENNKGPLAGMLVVLEALLRADALDANIEILVEGEEETGSTALQAFLTDPATPVRRAHAALFPGFCEYGGGAPRVWCGFKGIQHGCLRSAGGAWGGPHRAIHGSNAPWIASPAWRLVQALALLAAPPTGQLGRISMPPTHAALLDALAQDFDPAEELCFRAAEAYAIPGDARTLLEHVLTVATLGLSCLAIDPLDARGIIPAAADARFELRLPPGMAPATVLAELRGRLDAAGLSDVALEPAEGFPGYLFPPDAPGVRPLTDTYRALGTTPRVWPWAIGAAPAHAFARVAGSFLIGGLGHGGNAHGIDEFVTLAGIDRFHSSLLRWLPALAAEAQGQIV
jgi:acetylornithine deacetylase/succinyl-diaminopimelate desuccinylase-like protein